MSATGSSFQGLGGGCSGVVESGDNGSAVPPAALLRLLPTTFGRVLQAAGFRVLGIRAASPLRSNHDCDVTGNVAWHNGHNIRLDSHNVHLHLFDFKRRVTLLREAPGNLAPMRLLQHV